jgi:hypothetical protein
MLQTSKIHNLFIEYPNIHILVCLNPVENGKKTHKYFCHFNNNK